jgi:cell division protein FtsZ
MVFITAGMGGNRNGAAPVLHNCQRKRYSYSRIVTFLSYLKESASRTSFGIEKLRKQVDSLIVINNNKLREVYGNLGFKAGFSKKMKF